MAQKVTIVVTDDIDGSGNAETRSFSLAGVDYEIDLTDANYAKLSDDLAPWVAKARKATRRTSSPRTARRPGGSRSPEELTEIRAWARKHGHQVADRGRIAADVIAAYEAAN